MDEDAGSTNGSTRDGWLSIGACGRRSFLSPKALRLYGRMDVLSPAAVDAGNGYRQYRESPIGTAP